MHVILCLVWDSSNRCQHSGEDRQSRRLGFKSHQGRYCDVGSRCEIDGPLPTPPRPRANSAI